MGKNRYPKISGGVDNHCKKRTMLTALLLGALFCWGNNAEAYTYNQLGPNINVDKITEDEYDLVVDICKSVTSNESINVKKRKQQQIEKKETANCVDLDYPWGDNSGWTKFENMPAKVSPELGELLNEKISRFKKDNNYLILHYSLSLLFPYCMSLVT